MRVCVMFGLKLMCQRAFGVGIVRPNRAEHYEPRHACLGGNIVKAHGPVAVDLVGHVRPRSSRLTRRRKPLLRMWPKATSSPSSDISEDSRISAIGVWLFCCNSRATHRPVLPVAPATRIFISLCLFVLTGFLQKQTSRHAQYVHPHLCQPTNRTASYSITTAHAGAMEEALTRFEEGTCACTENGL